MDALAGRDHARQFRLSQPAHIVGEDARRIHHHMCRDLHALARLAVDRDHTISKAIRAPGDLHHRCVVEQDGALISSRVGQVDQQASVIELAVVVDDPAAEPLGLDSGQPLQSLFARKQARLAKTIFAREQVINLHADAVERSFPPGIVGHDEAQIVDQVGSVLAQQAAFLQSLHHQRHISLLQIADAAVDQLGAPARRS